MALKMALVSRYFSTLLLLQIYAVLLALADDAGQKTKPPPCPSEIYCHGNLLHTVQMAGIYKDSKTFVDMKLKNPPNVTLASFDDMMNRTDESPTKNDIQKFINDYFDPAGSEFEEWDPKDWKAEPKFLRKIKDKDLKEFVKKLHHIWKMLGRKMKNDVKENQDLYSIIWVPNPVIVPGGRFREFYYWDSYWIVKGLLLSEMHETVKGMLSNFVSIVDRIGLIPNGGRIYYTQRSQPPMLIPMVEEYLRATNDYEWLKENFWLLEKEFDFWMTKRTVQVKSNGVTYTLARYCENSSGPRPESYREDYLTSQSFRTKDEKENYYNELKTAAESGWDFSSRWFIFDDGTNRGMPKKSNLIDWSKEPSHPNSIKIDKLNDVADKIRVSKKLDHIRDTRYTLRKTAGNLTNLKTRSIIPVDLNSIIYKNARLLAKYARHFGNETKASYYDKRGDDWIKAVTAVLWHDEVGAWLDYDILNDNKRDYFYPTNILPLWTGCYDAVNREMYVSKVLKYLEKTQIMLSLGGIPATLEHSGEQWDYPNAWPPLQYFVIMSLDHTGDPWAQKLAYEITQRWVRSNFKAFNESHAMYEKYDATVSGGGGGGGEYEVQLGFGWSNGIIMDLVNKYAETLTAEDHFVLSDVMELKSIASQAVMSSAGQIMTGVLALIISVAAGFIG